VKKGVFYLPVFIEMDGNPAMAFYSGNGIDGYFACHDDVNSKFQIPK
jgi:hypothetical protein